MIIAYQMDMAKYTFFVDGMTAFVYTLCMKASAEWTKEDLKAHFGMSLSGTANYRKTKKGYNVSVMSRDSHGYWRVSVSLDNYLSAVAVDPKRYLTQSEAEALA